jgi:hypothetical protein
MRRRSSTIQHYPGDCLIYRRKMWYIRRKIRYDIRNMTSRHTTPDFSPVYRRKIRSQPEKKSGFPEKNSVSIPFHRFCLSCPFLMEFISSIWKAPSDIYTPLVPRAWPKISGTRQIWATCGICAPASSGSPGPTQCHMQRCQTRLGRPFISYWALNQTRISTRTSISKYGLT